MEEKLIILRMLEEGKITSEEALQLLESLNKEHKQKKTQPMDDKLNDTINKFSKKAEKFAEKIGPDFISRVESVSADFADAAVKFADKMVDFFGSGFNSNDTYKTVLRNLSFPISNQENIKVVLKTQNLTISVDTADTQEILLDMKLNLSDEKTNIDKFIETRTEDNVIYINTQFPSKTWGKLNIKVPKNIDNFQIQTRNSKCFFEDFKASYLYCNTSNGKIEIKNCNCNKLQVITSNGKIVITDTKALHADADTSNGNIELNNSSFDRLKSITNNSNIYLSNFNSINTEEAKYELQTSNGKIKIGLSKDHNIAHKINANTSVGNINISELGSSYIIERDSDNMKTQVTLTSNAYQESDKKISINAMTSNSSIYIINE